MTAPKPNVFVKKCPSRAIFGRLSDKWSMLILILLKDQPLRFNQIKKGIDGISQKVLTNNLRKLECDGLLTRTVFDGKPLRVEYKITPFALELCETFLKIKKWAEDNQATVSKNKAKYDRHNADYGD